MSSLLTWLLLPFLFGIWFFWLFASAVGKRADDLRARTPPKQRRGVDVLPVIPLFPLFFWGIAWVADRFFYPWGSVSVGGLHVILTLLTLGSVLREFRFCRSHDDRA